ncbi:CheR family methyltransferase [Granulosicoccus antarcticus]|uniref:protein-glutamate O-methyltransferase n=1 Tax=Granulosicoccus antarcticus IMCC3135 TaxID=1192854 RepID=A0A2Z2NGZ0_9GAMM|nr:protein-glutamate O-methyltransferase CheR [Granulosicoccus antarcticus]ASJ70399.1 Chemotaxis protein methyltransferase Cher2 [Granulosicoccus antarcticus IMCC3135]
MNPVSALDFDYVRDLVYRESAIAIDPDMQYLVESRLTSLIRKTEFSDIPELVSSLRRKHDPEMVCRVVDAMTTNETSFFRDSHPFETLCKDVLQRVAKSHSDTIRIWCAACSTGQEAYTIAMSILEHCPELMPRISILGTDISAEVVAKAQSGQYNRLEVNRGLPMQYLTKYFTQQGLAWEVKPILKESIRFEQMNLIGSWEHLPQMDIIFMRNVLIYFDPDVKSRMLGNTTKVLRSGGCLFLGLSETTLNLNTNYQRVTTDSSHYYKLA